MRRLYWLGWAFIGLLAAHFYEQMTLNKKYIGWTLFLIGLYGFLLGLIYYFRWGYENSPSELATVILYVVVIAFYIKDIQRYFDFYPVLVFLFMILRELSLMRMAAEAFGLVDFYTNALFRLAVLLALLALIAFGLWRSAGNIGIFLRQKGYLCFLLAMFIIALTSQISDRLHIATRFWFSFEEAGEVFLPIMLLVMFALLKSDGRFREIKRRSNLASRK